MAWNVYWDWDIPIPYHEHIIRHRTRLVYAHIKFLSQTQHFLSSYGPTPWSREFLTAVSRVTIRSNVILVSRLRDIRTKSFENWESHTPRVNILTRVPHFFLYPPTCFFPLYTAPIPTPSFFLIHIWTCLFQLPRLPLMKWKNLLDAFFRRRVVRKYFQCSKLLKRAGVASCKLCPWYNRI